jgi:UDP-N-acetylmuramate-alanine ligase
LFCCRERTGKQQPSILGHILYESGADVTSFIGGIVENYNSNLVGDGKTVTVVEADEFDRSFAFAQILLALRQWMRTI